MRKRISEDGHRLTQSELNHRFQDKHASIDEELDEAISMINWKRRKEAEKSLRNWVKTYCVGLLLDEEPPEKGNEILDKMEQSITSHRNYMICMGRGNGKSSYVECTSLYAMSLGLQKFIVIISNNSRAASGMMQDLYKAIAEKDTAFAQDYPTVCVPFQLCNGSTRRRQLYKGKTTDIERNSGNIVLARIDDCPQSGAVIAVRGIGGAIRGLKKGTLRPSLVLLDDLQDAEIASNPEQVAKLMRLIRKDIIPMAGKERLSILQTATPICPDDLVEQIKQDKDWTTQCYPVIIERPKNKDLWKQYFDLYDKESISETIDHSESLRFYQDNFEDMNEGAVVFNPNRFSKKDGHISALQKFLELEHTIGNLLSIVNTR